MPVAVTLLCLEAELFVSLFLNICQIVCVPYSLALFIKHITKIHIVRAHSLWIPFPLTCMLEQLLISRSSVDGHLTSFWSVTVRDGYAVGILECVFWVCI